MKKVDCILLVDDNEADNEFHRRAILAAGVCNNIVITPSGTKALEYLVLLDNTKPRPDIIFLDINMPGMNGFEFLEEYKQLDPSLQGKIVVFMLTSSRGTGDLEKAGQSGTVSDFLNKPLTAATVTEIIAKYF